MTKDAYKAPPPSSRDFFCKLKQYRAIATATTKPQKIPSPQSTSAAAIIWLNDDRPSYNHHPFLCEGPIMYSAIVFDCEFLSSRMTNDMRALSMTLPAAA